MTGAKNILPYINAVFEGDCLEIMENIPASSIDMVLCDLPYGTTRNKWDSRLDLNLLWKCYERIVKPNGAIVLNAQGMFTARLMLSNEALFKYKIVWLKSKPTNFLNAKKQPLRKYEDVCIFYKKQPFYSPQMETGRPYTKGIRKNQDTGSYNSFKPVLVESSDGKRYPTDVIYFKTAESEGNVWHPTQKPVALGRYFIRTYTMPGEIVLDNTCGSGSYLVAAILEGRNCVGIEKNVLVECFRKERIDYVALCKARMRQAYLTLPANAGKNICKVNVLYGLE